MVLFLSMYSQTCESFILASVYLFSVSSTVNVSHNVNDYDGYILYVTILQQWILFVPLNAKFIWSSISERCGVVHLIASTIVTTCLDNC
jgi:hypothetical protein